MAEKKKPVAEPKPSDRDEPVKIDLDPEVALKALAEAGPHPESKGGDDCE